MSFGGDSADNVSISGFKITGATGHPHQGEGIQCPGGADDVITNNIIVRNERRDIYWFNSSPIITNNTRIKNGFEGMVCEESSATVQNNTITENAIGISCIHCSSSLTIIIGNGITCSKVQKDSEKYTPQN
ncbi:MAG: right-handed parallel beta-helix repeat-containing protein [bacterium]